MTSRPNVLQFPAPLASLRCVFALLGALLLPAALRAADNATHPPIVEGGASPPAGTEIDLREHILRMTEFFDTMLPGVLDKNNVTLHFTPKFSDVRDHEYVRYPLELRYGAGNGWEFYGGPTPFSPNPLNGGRDHRWGVGEIRLGARYDYGPSFGFFNDTTFGFETRVPLGKPPIDLNDHYTHLRPFITAARHLTSWPDVTFYSNLSYDRSVRLFPREAAPPGVTRRNIVEVAPGYLYKPNEFGYFVECRLRHIAEDTEAYLGHEFRLGSLWDVPLWRTARLGLPGKWQLELAYRVTHEEGRATDQGFVARVNWRTTLREVFNATRQ